MDGSVTVVNLKTALIGIAAMCASAVALAEEASLASSHEIGVFGGFRSGGNFADGVTREKLDLDEGSSAGMIVRIPQSEDSYMEIFYSVQGTRTQANGTVTGDPFFDMDVSYLHIGGMKEFNGSRNRPYVLASVGLTHFEPAGSSLESETRFSLGVGGGYRWPMTRSASLRLEARAIGTAFNTSGGVFCTSGRCSIEVDSDAFWQAEVSLTFALAF